LPGSFRTNGKTAGLFRTLTALKAPELALPAMCTEDERPDTQVLVRPGRPR